MQIRQEMTAQLKQEIAANRHIIGVAAGSGLTARHAQKGGADFILALSSGYFRQKGVSSLAGYLPVANSNHVVMDFASKEIIPAMSIPTLFGLSATDPLIRLESYIEEIQSKGFSGIVNYPTVGLIDGQFQEALEEQGMSYQSEIKAIRLAHKHGLFTVAFVFNETQAREMLASGADVICIHLGLTTGGTLGGKQFKSLQASKRLVIAISQVCNELQPDVIKMIYGGPFNKPVDVQFMYDGTDIDGYIGGSAFERIPTEYMISSITRSFKTSDDTKYHDTLRSVTHSISSQDDYIDFIKQYISFHYNENLTLKELADMVSLSSSYVSTLFKEKMGISFREYLINYRLNRAIKIMQETPMPLKILADMVGYSDYAQFSKIFKKRKGLAPRMYFDTYGE